NDITLSSRVVTVRNYEEYKCIRVDNKKCTKNDNDENVSMCNIIYESKIATDITPIHSKICHRLFLWVFCMKNYFASNENELSVCSVNKCCTERFVTNKFACHDAVANNETYDVLKVDLHKVM
ncbi:hypothetical protein COBT_003756, partial [Conglomerata obtusa]